MTFADLAACGRCWPTPGVVPTVRSSGGTIHVGRINRRNHCLACAPFTQAVPHLVDSSPVLRRFCRQLLHRKEYGRARIALFRKAFGIMRRMLLWDTPHR